MMNESPLHSRLLDLLSKKDFETLSQEEKEFAALHLSESEYKSLRSFHRKVETTFTDENTIILDSSVKKSLDKAFEKKYHRSSSLVEFFCSIIELKIPAYQAALGCGLTLLLASWYFHYQSYALDSTPLLAVADTVFIEREKPARVDTIYLTQKATSKNYSSKVEKQTAEGTEIRNTSGIRAMDFPEQNMIYITDFKNINTPGSTISEDSLPREFMSGIL